MKPAGIPYRFPPTLRFIRSNELFAVVIRAHAAQKAASDI